ncbi:MAG: VWA domain-containing protein [bacterium]
MKKIFLISVFILSFLFFLSCGSEFDGTDSQLSGDDSGNSGEVNDNYDDGDSGNTGNTGNKGDEQDTGDTGNTGDTGDIGDTGDTGDTGDYDSSDDDEENSDNDPSGDEEDAEVGELIENEFVETSEEHTSTFSIDVDTASYSLVRNYILNYNQLPPQNKVRIEEMVNYFDYDYPKAEDGEPFSVTMEMSPSPWRDDANLVMFGLKGKEISPDLTPSSNLVFLIDTSGSMYSQNKLPLLKTAFKQLVDMLSEDDSVSIVTYAGSLNILADSVPGNEKGTLKSAIDSLEAGGSTAGAEGIKTAYELAEKNLNTDGNNRVILATDGDFNVGVSSNEALVSMIEEEREKGIFLTILGLGMGNYKDDKMEELSNAGNGNYFYIDTEKEAEKVFVHDLMGNMFTIAKDVKLQVVFNPEKIHRYRLIGYENRVLENEDFDDDTKDAGEIGSGHRVTAFYEVIMREEDEYEAVEIEEEFKEEDILLLKMRYKEPDEDISKYMDTFMTEDYFSEDMSENMGFASSVVECGMLLRKSKFRENSSYDAVKARAMDNLGKDTFGYRGEFLEIVDKAKSLDK